MATLLHQERLDVVVQELLNCGAKRVIDLGCGEGELLQQLAQHPQFERLLGIDIDPRVLNCARENLDLDPLAPKARVQVRYGSFEEVDPMLPKFDAAVMLETIEHIDPRNLSRVERTLFGAMRPANILITTPNQEYNVLHGMSPGQRRHPGHRFEWTRPQFQHWCSGVAQRNNYQVRFVDLGPPDPTLGSSTQMGRFSLHVA